MTTSNLLLRVCGLGLKYRTCQRIQARSVQRWLSKNLKEFRRRSEIIGPLPKSPRSSYLDWNYRAEWYAFGKRLGEHFNETLLQNSFTHRSYIVKEEESQKEAGIENPEINLTDNRELVEKGQNFMSKYIDIYVRLLLPKFPEEGIRAVCGHLTSLDVLVHVSSNIGTKDLILSADYPPEQETLVATLMAVIGALLESSGPERAGLFVRDFIITQLVGKDVNDIWHPHDPVRTLSEVLLKQGREAPEPRLINESGKNTILAAYQVAFYSNKEFLGAGCGETVPTATYMAGYDALKRMFQTADSMHPFSFKLNPNVEKVAPVVTEHLSISDWKP